MGATLVVGMQWGDEAKGKIVDMLAQDHDYVVRFNGGANAGHTIKHGDVVFKLNLLPSGVFYPEKIKVVGNGVVADPRKLIKEIADIESKGFSLRNLVISDSAHLVMPWHITLDGIEDKRGGIGTTKRGIGPAYADKASRVSALRVGDLLLPEKELAQIIGRIGNLKNTVIVSLGGEKLDLVAIAKETAADAKILRKYIAETRFLLNDALAKGKKILLEGAQGSLLDIDHGTYPFVSSSSITAGGACTGTGIPPKKISNIIGVTKAYATRVGSGPFPTELTDATGEKIRQKGAEFGTTTGRPRRCGWLDLVALHYTCMINGPDSLAMMKADVLDGLDELNVCTEYEVDGKRTKQFPVDITKLQGVKPVYKSFKGWKAFDWKSAKGRKDLPKELQDYLAFIEKEIGTPIKYLSYGPARNETLVL